VTIMIPSTIVRPSTPKGEKRLFKLLQSVEGSEDWIALHSFDIVKHETKTSGEIDMILIIPKAGILFLEVKGVGVRRERGKWLYDDGRRSDAGPFVQASSAMHSIRNLLSKSLPESAGLMFFSAVVFPEFEFNLPAYPLEWHDWQVIDQRKLNSGNLANLFRGVLEKAHKHMASVGKRWYDNERSRPSTAMSEKLAAFLRPNFSFAPNDRSAINFIEETIHSYTLEQLMVLDSFDDNERILVTGPAGTGKTVIAIEAFRRAVISGKKVLFLCFNRHLGNKIQKELDSFLDEKNATQNAQIHTLHSYLVKVGNFKVPQNPESTYWNETLPEQALEAILEDRANKDVLVEPDLLIVDEAQDLMLPSYLECLEAILGKELSKSKWLLLGDFKNQSIYDGDIKYFDEKCSNSFFRYTLTRNCRNAGQVAGQIKLVFGVQPAYKMTLPDLDGAEAKVEFWKNSLDQAELLSKTLKNYLLKFSPEEIHILTPLRRSDGLEGLTGEWKSRLVEFDPLVRRRGKISYSTISSFKGLESPVIIITGVDDLSPETLTLLYVAISRAKVCVKILMHQRCRRRWEMLLLEGIKK
jgi:hypothetical protein